MIHSKSIVRARLACIMAQRLHTPSLYDEAICALVRRGHEIAPDLLDRDWSQPRPYSADVEAAWLAIYQQPTEQWELYELAEKLVDLEDSFRQWRFRHLTTVERIIGLKRGTGGTSGAGYLKGVMDIQLFPELWRVRTSL